MFNVEREIDEVSLDRDRRANKLSETQCESEKLAAELTRSANVFREELLQGDAAIAMERITLANAREVMSQHNESINEHFRCFSNLLSGVSHAVPRSLSELGNLLPKCL